jgi:uncharacterized protein with ParB-like and HNH nuclease domain
MTTTEQYTIHEVIRKIKEGSFKIPILQRRYVWSKEQVKDLFTSIFADNTFGAISAVKTTDDYPIFASRTFVEDLKDDRFKLSEDNDGLIHDNNNQLYLILDGQQRLQSFYLGLTSKFDGLELCFDKYKGTFDYLDKYDRNVIIPIKQLYECFDGGKIPYSIIAKRFNSSNDYRVNSNIFKFYYNIFYAKSVVILLSFPNKLNEKEDKNKLFELFKKINTGGVNLNVYDICVSKLKAFNPKMEVLFCKLESLFSKIKYYPYDLPYYRGLDSYFIAATKNKHNFYIEYHDYLIKEWIRIICSCYAFLPFQISNHEKVLEQRMDLILRQIESNFNVELLFEFIDNVYYIYRMISIPKRITPIFIKNMFENYIGNDSFNMQIYLIQYVKTKYIKYFIDNKSVELFSLKYLIYLFF